MCHVLVIEDDLIVVSDIQETLRSAGATSFSVAVSLTEALQAARSMRPAVVTADVMLGDSSGLEAARAVQAEFGPLPVIFVTGSPSQCFGCDPQRIIEKPFDPERLKAVFRAVSPGRQP